MREMLSPTLRRRELGVELRILRTEEGLTEERVAEWINWPPSKVSRIEKAHLDQTTNGMRDREALFSLDGARFTADGGIRGSHRRGSHVEAPIYELDQIAALVTPHLTPSCRRL